MPPIADDVVDWNALLDVIWLSLAAGVGVAGAFAFAILGATRAVDMGRAGRRGEAAFFAAVMVVGVTLSAAAVVLGIIAMTSK